MEYPKFRFHRTEKEQIVTDPAHEDAVANSEAGWVDHPSQFADPAEDPDGSEADNSALVPESSKQRKARLAKEVREAAKPKE